MGTLYQVFIFTIVIEKRSVFAIAIKYFVFDLNSGAYIKPLKREGHV